MQEFLRALLYDWERRCATLRDRLSGIPADPDVRDHALGGYQVVERARRDTVRLLEDPSLGASALLANHLQTYRRGDELATLVESDLLPFVERYSESDRRLTRLCRCLLEQVHGSLPAPLVVALSSQYYWTQPVFNLICVPAAEETSFLGLPDLCHELGHILFLHHEPTLVGNFVEQLAEYILQEQRWVDTDQRPPQYRSLYDVLFSQWRDAWIQEFVSDMIATYLVGPAFRWQHVRLCAGRSQGAFYPSLGETAQHPADEARLCGIEAVLGQIGMADVSSRIRALWNRYVDVSRESMPADYPLCYSQSLIESLAQNMVEGCRSLGLRSYSDRPSPTQTKDIPSLIGV